MNITLNNLGNSNVNDFGFDNDLIVLDNAQNSQSGFKNNGAFTQEANNNLMQSNNFGNF